MKIQTQRDFRERERAEIFIYREKRMSTIEDDVALISWLNCMMIDFVPKNEEEAFNVQKNFENSNQREILERERERE